QWSKEPRLVLLAAFPHRADWAAELARTKRNTTPRDLLLETLTDPELILDVVKAHGVAACVVSVVPALRERAAAMFGAMFDVVRFPNEEKAVARSLGCIGTSEAAATFVQHLRKKNVRPYATEFFATFPHLAEPALGELAKKKTQVAEIARTILASLDRARAVADSSGSSPIEEAAADDVPRALREPPWTNGAPAKRRPKIVPNLVVPAEPMALHWSERARRRWLADRWTSSGLAKSPEDVAKVESALAGGEKLLFSGRYPEALTLAVLSTPHASIQVSSDAPIQALAVHGASVLVPVLEHHADHLDEIRLHVESPKIAMSLARKELRGTWRRAPALHWIERYPEAAALGLVACAVDEDEKTRDAAELGLRHLVTLGHRDVVMRAAASYGAEVVAATEELLAADDMRDGPKRAPRMPPHYRPEELGVPRLKSGASLPRAAVENLDRLLCASALESPLACLGEVRDACEPRSLAEHAWDLARAWDINGAKDSARWMLHAVAHLGDDEVVRRLTPALKGDGIPAMLGVIATDAALMELITIRVRVARSATRMLPRYAIGTEEAIQLISARRGCNVDELEDHFVPTCNVDAEGEIALDLGKRRYRITFDAQLTRVLLDESGERVQSLPRGAKADDPEKVQAAVTLLTDLEEDVSAIAFQRAASLERAMIDGRSWSLDDFQEVWAKHPLMKHMARGVLWEARLADGSRSEAFRVAEDSSFAEVDDAPFELPADATSIGVAHPVRWTNEARARWRTLFGDYEILQPFDQLAREPAVLSGDELAGESIRRDGKPNEDAIRDRLERVGWERPYVGLLVLPCENDEYALIRTKDDAATGTVARNGRAVALSEVSELVRSELVRALEIATGAR
ncbi:MAG: Molybdate metabolism regulator, partial [Labilithrix sp.]|nr:Molybdate metabolism regulator [Labilithrix sp.]